QIALLDPCKDPIVHLSFNPTDAAVTQRDRPWEGTLPDVLVDGRPRQAGRIDDFFQADDPHERAPLLLRGCTGDGFFYCDSAFLALSGKVTNPKSNRFRRSSSASPFAGQIFETPGVVSWSTANLFSPISAGRIMIVIAL